MDEDKERLQIINRLKNVVQEREISIINTKKELKKTEEEITNNNYLLTDPLKLQRLKNRRKHKTKTIKSCENTIKTCEDLIKAHENKEIAISDKNEGKYHTKKRKYVPRKIKHNRMKPSANKNKFFK
ncbi:MAG: hypothetical protein FWH29_03590 [Methanobrevibacter sp.]|nr:hypothetical protein [Methanobrevibacter sp.]